MGSCPLGCCKTKCTFSKPETLFSSRVAVWHTKGAVAANAVLKEPDFFFAKDRPSGPLQGTTSCQPPPTANHHPPPTTNHQPPPTASSDQPPSANHGQPPPTTNHQPPTDANRHQPPVANSRPPTANRHQPWLSTWSARGLFWETIPEHFFFPVQDRPSCSLCVI